MDIWLGIGIASLSLALGTVLVSKLRARSNRLVRRSGRRRELEDQGSVMLDESEAYWGDAVPEGVEHAMPMAQASAQPVAARQPSTARERAAAAASSPAPELVRPKKHEERREAMPEPLRKSAPAEKALGEAACALGVDFVDKLIGSQHLLPGMRGHCSRSALVNARRALERRAPTLPLGHGAVLQRIGEGFAVLFEPQAEPVSNPDALIEIIAASLRDTQLYVVLGAAASEPSNDAASAYLPRLISRLGVSATHFFMLEEDGSFHNAIENKRHFVPCHLDAQHIPEAFFAKMVGYAQERFDAIEPEAALRCLGPLTDVLWERATQAQFDGLLLAQALNLLGTANRMLEAHHEAASCFEAALYLLKRAEEYEAIQVVETNLGVSLLTLGREQPELLREATQHFQASVKLNPQDFLCWKRLGDTYRMRFSMEGSSSMLGRAEHAYRQALRLRNDQEVRTALEQISGPQPHRENDELASPLLLDDAAAREPLQRGYER